MQKGKIEIELSKIFAAIVIAVLIGFVTGALVQATVFKGSTLAPELIENQNIPPQI